MTLSKPPLILYGITLITIIILMGFALHANEHGLQSRSRGARGAFFAAILSAFFLSTFLFIHAAACLTLAWRAWLQALGPGQA